MTTTSALDSAALHADALVIDGTCPIGEWKETIDTWIAGGTSACVVSVAAWESCRETVDLLADVHARIRKHPELLLATSVADIRRAKEERRLAVVLHFQGTEPLEGNVELADLYWRLGVRIIQMTYNKRCAAGDGCEVDDDAGLTLFGTDLVREFNRLGVVVDVSHTGDRTSLDAIAASSRPSIASHSNPRAVHDSKRNIPDELIRAIAESGGVVGANGFPAFVSSSARPTLDEYIDHIVYVSDLVGPEHAGIGLDYTTRNVPIAQYQALVDDGHWSPATYPPPPWHYPAGLDDAAGLPNLTSRLLERGFGEAETRGILGANWLRVFDQVWTTPE